MRTFGCVLAGAALALLFCGAADAVPVLTTPTMGAADGSRLTCIVTNFGKKPATLVITIIDPFTSTTLSTTDCGGALGAGSACFSATPNTGFKNGYCQVTGSGKLKVALWVQDTAGNTVSVVQASK